MCQKVRIEYRCMNCKIPRYRGDWSKPDSKNTIKCGYYDKWNKTCRRGTTTDTVSKLQGYCEQCHHNVRSRLAESGWIGSGKTRWPRGSGNLITRSASSSPALSDTSDGDWVDEWADPPPSPSPPPSSFHHWQQQRYPPRRPSSVMGHRAPSPWGDHHNDGSRNGRAFSPREQHHGRHGRKNDHYDSADRYEYSRAPGRHGSSFRGMQSGHPMMAYRDPRVSGFFDGRDMDEYAAGFPPMAGMAQQQQQQQRRQRRSSYSGGPFAPPMMPHTRSFGTKPHRPDNVQVMDDSEADEETSTDEDEIVEIVDEGRAGDGVGPDGRRPSSAGRNGGGRVKGSGKGQGRAWNLGQGGRQSGMGFAQPPWVGPGPAGGFPPSRAPYPPQDPQVHQA